MMTNTYGTPPLRVSPSNIGVNCPLALRGSPPTIGVVNCPPLRGSLPTIGVECPLALRGSPPSIGIGRYEVVCSHSYQASIYWCGISYSIYQSCRAS